VVGIAVLVEEDVLEKCKEKKVVSRRPRILCVVTLLLRSSNVSVWSDC
jgi:hypothetical protein